jgi:hypothetical protein
LFTGGEQPHRHLLTVEPNNISDLSNCSISCHHETLLALGHTP